MQYNTIIKDIDIYQRELNMLEYEPINSASTCYNAENRFHPKICHNCGKCWCTLRRKKAPSDIQNQAKV
jgi:7-cyano-7-deazaguanine synthase in queuosine biosynthesis